jgi:YD repeat-containing protein
VDRQGTLFIADTRNGRIRKVTPDGIITTVVAGLANPTNVAVDALGTLSIYEEQAFRIRVLSPNGTLRTLAGTGIRGFSGDGGPSQAAQLDLAWPTALGMGLAVDAQGFLVVADFHNHRLRRIERPFPGFAGGEFLIPSADGGVVDVFSPAGQHLRTLHALTGAVLLAFGYDAQGRLSTLTDADANITTIERDGVGQPTALGAPMASGPSLPWTETAIWRASPTRRGRRTPSRTPVRACCRRTPPPGSTRTPSPTMPWAASPATTTRPRASRPWTRRRRSRATPSPWAPR